MHFHRILQKDKQQSAASLDRKSGSFRLIFFIKQTEDRGGGEEEVNVNSFRKRELNLQVPTIYNTTDTTTLHWTSGYCIFILISLVFFRPPPPLSPPSFIHTHYTRRQQHLLFFVAQLKQSKQRSVSNWSLVLGRQCLLVQKASRPFTGRTERERETHTKCSWPPSIPRSISSLTMFL